MPDTTEEVRFWLKVQKQLNGCWIWTACKKAGSPYGLFSSSAGTVLAHRFSYRLRYGLIPEGKCVLHKRHCNNGSCVNPEHLYIGTEQDNSNDSIATDRQVRGERHGRAKLTDKQVAAAVRRVAAGETRDAVAESLGVDPSTVERAVRGETWGHVETGTGESRVKVPHLPHAKKLITDSMAAEMRLMFLDDVPQTIIATTFETDKATVHAIIHNKTHVDPGYTPPTKDLRRKAAPALPTSS